MVILPQSGIKLKINTEFTTRTSAEKQGQDQQKEMS